MFPPEKKVFVAMKGCVVAGVGSVIKSRGKWFLRSCVVAPKHRGQGVQWGLIQARLKWLESRTDEVYVLVSPKNFPSLNNLTWAGFRFHSKRYRYFGGEEMVSLRYEFPRRVAHRHD